MGHSAINHDTEPIRLFKSNFLEFFTHIHPAVVVLLWLPLCLYFLLAEVINASGRATGMAHIPAAFTIGLFIWTFAEYTLHRFLFHYKPKVPKAEKIFFLFHGVHHAQPQCKTRLVMPPVLSIPMALVFYWLFSRVVGGLLGAPAWVGPMFSGFGIGYLVYDLTHYATHHFAMRSGVLKYLKRYHMQHHYKTPDARFGVSSPLWDIVFNTKPAK